MDVRRGGAGREGMRGGVTVVVLIVALLYAGLCALMFVGQRSLIYFPRPLALATEQITLKAEDGTLLAASTHGSGSAALFYFGGNAEDVSLSLPELAETFPGRTLYLMHYRGYGASEGRPSEAALVADALALYDAVAERHERVAVVGRSIGSGIATQLAASRRVDALVLVTPFDSLRAVAQRHFPVLPVRWLMRDRYESWRHAPQVRAPTRLIVAERDDIVPPVRAQALLEHFPAGVAKLHVVPQAGHNDLSMYPVYRQLLREAVPD